MLHSMQDDDELLDLVNDDDLTHMHFPIDRR